MTLKYAFTLVSSLLIACPINALFQEIGIGVALAGAAATGGRSLLIAYRLHNKGEGYKKKLQELGAPIKDKIEVVGQNLAQTGYYVGYPAQVRSTDHIIQIDKLFEKLNTTYSRQQKHTMIGGSLSILSAIGITVGATILLDEMHSK